MLMGKVSPFQTIASCCVHELHACARDGGGGGTSAECDGVVIKGFRLPPCFVRFAKYCFGYLGCNQECSVLMD